jgi:flagellar hook-basal body complex protein FliE
MPVDPVSAITLGPEFRVSLEEGAARKPNGSGSGFGAALLEQVEKLDKMQKEAEAQSQALATGEAEDVTQVVLAVERASLAIQLAAQTRNRAVEAYQDLFRMQI